MRQNNVDQYNKLKAKGALSTEETAVVAAYDAVEASNTAETNAALVKAQDALVATPSTTV